MHLEFHLWRELREKLRENYRKLRAVAQLNKQKIIIIKGDSKFNAMTDRMLDKKWVFVVK